MKNFQKLVLAVTFLYSAQTAQALVLEAAGTVAAVGMVGAGAKTLAEAAITDTKKAYNEAEANKQTYEATKESFTNNANISKDETLATLKQLEQAEKTFADAAKKDAAEDMIATGAISLFYGGVLGAAATGIDHPREISAKAVISGITGTLLVVGTLVGISRLKRYFTKKANHYKELEQKLQNQIQDPACYSSEYYTQANY